MTALRTMQARAYQRYALPRFLALGYLFVKAMACLFSPTLLTPWPTVGSIPRLRALFLFLKNSLSKVQVTLSGALDRALDSLGTYFQPR